MINASLTATRPKSRTLKPSRRILRKTVANDAIMLMSLTPDARQSANRWAEAPTIPD
jgi:hypothetical protein